MSHDPRAPGRLFFVLTIAFNLGQIGCTEPAEPPAAPEPEPSSNVVEVIARGLEFVAPEEIPSGWTTFRFKNESDMIHFAVIQKLPDGVGVAEQQAEVAPVFQAGMDLLNAGQVDEALAKFGDLPPWFEEIVFMGGPGLTTGGKSAESTVFLAPGGYMLECYVKTNGIFHSYNAAPEMYGMVHGFSVTSEVSTASEPEATLRITVSSERGMEIEGLPTVGEQVVAVHYEDQIVHENFLGHDVHLARLAEDTDLEQLAVWMDWSQPTGLETPAPVEFLGGNHEMPAGSTGYFNVTLEPGRYAWIAEVTNPAEKGMLVAFEVTE